MPDEPKDNVSSININPKNTTSSDVSGNIVESTPPPPTILLSDADKIIKLGHGELERNLLIYLTRETCDIPPKDFGLGLRAVFAGQPLLRIGIYLPKENSDGYKIVEYLEGGLARELTKSALEGMMQDRVEIFGNYPRSTTAQYCFSDYQVGRLASRLLKSRRMRIADWPLPLGFKSSEGRFFNRRPFDPILGANPEDFPFINSYLERTTNARALCQVIGSVLAGKPLRKHTPLLYGESGGGKSTFYRLLKNLFGEDAVGLVPKSYKDKYSCTFIENTAAWFADELEPKFLATALFKELTGSDSFALRKMNKDYVKTPLKGVFFLNINTNQMVLPNDDAVTSRRLIPNEILITEKWTVTQDIKDDAVVDALAAKDYPAFSGYCLRLFEELKGGAVQYDLLDILDYVDGEEADLEVLFDMSFEFIPDRNVPGIGETPRVTVNRFIEEWEYIAKLRPIATKGKDNHCLRAWVAEKLGLKKGKLVKNTKWKGFLKGQAKCLQGIRLKKSRRDGYRG